MFKRILVPLDGSERAEQALPVAVRMARSSGGLVILLHVVDIVSSSYGYKATLPLLKSFIETSFSEAKKYLTDVTTSEMFKDVATEIHVPFGSVTTKLLEVADSCHADSIVLTSRGNTSITRWVLGSVAEYVILHATQPILLLQDDNASDGSLRFRPERPVRVLVPLDGSFFAKAALEPAAFLASALAAHASGTLHLTRVVKPGKATSRQEHYLQVIAEQMRKGNALARSDALDMTVTQYVVVHQDVAEGILTVAENAGHARGDDASGSSDVIAMATNGRRGLHRWMMGSVTEDILSKTELPLLIVRPTEEADKSNAVSEIPQREFPLARPVAADPTHYLMAVINDVEEAQDAVQALHQANVPAEDIRLFERHEIIKYAEHTASTRSLRSRIADVFQAITSDEDAHVLIYVEEALRGHAILNIYAPTSKQAESIKDVLVEHHARIIKHFGRWSITVLHH